MRVLEETHPRRVAYETYMRYSRHHEGDQPPPQDKAYKTQRASHGIHLQKLDLEEYKLCIAWHTLDL